MALHPAVSRLPQRCASYLEFSDTRHFAAWAVLCGSLAAFSLIHLRYVDLDGVFCRDGGLIPPNGAAPGECFYFLGLWPARLGLLVHLALILPASLLACMQFVPRIRRRAARVHRVGGRVSMVLALIGAAGALPTMPNAFGGDLPSQVAGYLMTFVFVGTQLAAYWHIKHRRVDQHRAWMMRSWSYASGIITLRILMAPAMALISTHGGFFMAQPCDKLDYILKGKDETLLRYPGCEPFYSGADPGQHVVVRADVSSPNLAEVTTAFNLTYGVSAWLGFTIHAVGVEIYLRSSGTKIKAK